MSKKKRRLLLVEFLVLPERGISFVGPKSPAAESGGRGYADGPLFVRVSMAMDAIIADLVEGLKDRRYIESHQSEKP